MPNRLRLYDCRNSRLPTVVGLCAADTRGVAGYVNSAQRRLLLANEAGDEGWWGTWAEMAFQVQRPGLTPVPPGTGPTAYLTTPMEVARLEGVNICDRPIPLQNQFFEYLQFGNGRLPKQSLSCHSRITQIYTRNNVPTFVDLAPPPQLLQVYATDPQDLAPAGKRVLIQGTDTSNTPFWSVDGTNRVLGQFLTLQAPFVAMPMALNSITGIQKDLTAGQVKFYQVDPVTGNQVLLLTMQPNETTASYRRYYFDRLPASCCQPQIPPAVVPQPLRVTAIVKLELIPVIEDTDYCLIQNLEAITEECSSIRYSEIDTESAKKMAAERHKQAIGLLRGELAHYLGIDNPAVEFAPFGSARLEKLKIGSMM